MMEKSKLFDEHTLDVITQRVSNMRMDSSDLIRDRNQNFRTEMSESDENSNGSGPSTKREVFPVELPKINSSLSKNNLIRGLILTKKSGNVKQCPKSILNKPKFPAYDRKKLYFPQYSQTTRNSPTN